MLNNVNLKKWLADNGGPSVLLHLDNDQKKGKTLENKLFTQLLKLDDVRNLLAYMDQFLPQPREKKTLEHLLHYYKDTCIDQFFPRLMDLGFRAGIKIFDKKMKPFRELFNYLLSAHYGYTIGTPRFFFMAGYAFQEVVDAVRERINLISQVADDQIFDIYQDKGKLPKTPKHWENVGVIKDELNPFSKGKPLPVFYDIETMAYFPDEYLDPDAKEKINKIISYILDPKFQQLPEGYGLLWNVKSNRTYHGCGWSPTLPRYLDYSRPGHYNEYSLLFYVNMMSHFTVAQESQWFQDCMKYLQQCQDEDGTFLFPKELLHRKYIPEAFLNESNLALKRNQRKEMLQRVASTLFMHKINQRIKT